MKRTIKMFFKRNKKFVFLSLFIVLVLSLFIIFNKDEKVYASNDNIEKEENIINEEIKVQEVQEEKKEEIKEETKEEILPDKIKVDIKGEVNNPGVYELELGNRIIDVVNLSGGFTKKAKTRDVNLSKKIYDEMVIIIPDNESVCVVTPTYNLDEKQDITEISGLVNLNTATKDDLLTLTGIGESKANAIIEYRKQKKFEKIEDIMNIAGIKETLFNKIKDEITV